MLVERRRFDQLATTKMLSYPASDISLTILVVGDDSPFRILMIHILSIAKLNLFLFFASSVTTLDANVSPGVALSMAKSRCLASQAENMSTLYPGLPRRVISGSNPSAYSLAPAFVAYPEN